MSAHVFHSFFLEILVNLYVATKVFNNGECLGQG
jgi:hypothetical protein